jgi:AraC-like DNA-binding protein
LKHLYHIPTDSFLKQYVSLIWEVEGTPIYSSEVILPRGYIELIFNFSEDVLYRTSKEPFHKNAPLSSIIGYNLSSVQGYYQKHHHFFGIRIKPIAVKHLLNINPGEITNEIIDLNLINKAYTSIWHQLAECNSFTQKIEIIKPLFLKFYSEVDKRTHFFNQLISNSHISNDLINTVGELANHSCFSERQLQRKTKEFFGVPPNELLRYKKFTNSIKLMHETNLSLSQITYKSGFFDQSHFIRVFKEYSDLTPKEYKNTKSIMPFHIFKNV